eukprot:2445076-Prymnesium_polylepis.1
MVADEAGFAKAVAACKGAAPELANDVDEIAVPILKKPELSERRVELLAEVQFHLAYYVEQREQTHVWFQLLRAADLQALNVDCLHYRDADGEA